MLEIERKRAEEVREAGARRLEEVHEAAERRVEDLKAERDRWAAQAEGWLMLRVLFLCGVISMPGTAYAQIADATDLRRFCAAAPDSDEFITGTAYVTRVISQSVRLGADSIPFCPPGTPQPEQMRDAVCARLQARRPAPKGEKPDVLVRSVLAEAWPCPSR
ncbi:Rap1a/Tai family immunity protein [Methylobacterium nigriterrae]|uniref:Rap1a/Tai family immunity protein n=1 Tax=Methylobacterium nigriterrae TaxID=3127512 RepID=UPI003013D62D